MQDKIECEQCKATYGMYDEEPPCEDCLPKLWPENRLIQEVYVRAGRQYIMSVNGPVAVDLLAAYKIMEEVGIEKEDRLFCLDMINAVFTKVVQLAKIGDGIRSN